MSKEKTAGLILGATILTGGLIANAQDQWKFRVTDVERYKNAVAVTTEWCDAPGIKASERDLFFRREGGNRDIALDRGVTVKTKDKNCK